MGSGSDMRLSALERCCWAAWEGRVILVRVEGLAWALVGIFWRGSLRRFCEVAVVVVVVVVERFVKEMACESEPFRSCQSGL